MDVTFKCSDGEQKCEKVYLTQSDFFSEKVEGFEKLKNDLEFGRGHKNKLYSKSLKSLIFLKLTTSKRLYKFQQRIREDFHRFTSSY